MECGLKIRTKDLTKRFGSFTAVNKLNLIIEPGESYGFLGPNGAGKTTTILMILGIHKPTNGYVLINDKQMNTSAYHIKRKIGVVAEYQSFYDEMSAWENLMFFASLFDVDDPENRIRELLERLGLWEWQNVLVNGYSSGMKKKLGFARALLHSPDLLILDEPVSGLDPFGIIQVRNILKNEQARGCTLLISSHILSEVERTADRVGIIYKGNLILQDSMENIRKKIKSLECIDLVFASINESEINGLKNLPFVEKLDKDGDHISLYTRSDLDYRELIGRHIVENRLILIEMKKVEKTLEDAFVTITENNLNYIAGEKI